MERLSKGHSIDTVKVNPTSNGVEITGKTITGNSDADLARQVEELADGAPIVGVVPDAQTKKGNTRSFGTGHWGRAQAYADRIAARNAEEKAARRKQGK